MKALETSGKIKCVCEKNPKFEEDVFEKCQISGKILLQPKKNIYVCVCRISNVIKPK